MGRWTPSSWPCPSCPSLSPTKTPASREYSGGWRRMRKTVQRDPVAVQNARRCRVERPGLASQPTCQWRRDMHAHNRDVHRSIHRSIARILRWVATPHHPGVASSYSMVYSINQPGVYPRWLILSTRLATGRLSLRHGSRGDESLIARIGSAALPGALGATQRSIRATRLRATRILKWVASWPCPSCPSSSPTKTPASRGYSGGWRHPTTLASPFHIQWFTTFTGLAWRLSGLLDCQPVASRSGTAIARMRRRVAPSAKDGAEIPSLSRRPSMSVRGPGLAPQRIVSKLDQAPGSS